MLPFSSSFAFIFHVLYERTDRVESASTRRTRVVEARLRRNGRLELVASLVVRESGRWIRETTADGRVSSTVLSVPEIFRSSGTYLLYSEARLRTPR